MSQLFQTTDMDLASETIRQMYASLRMRVESGQPLLRVDSTQVGQARLDRTTFGMSIDGSADPLPAVTILYFRSGTIRYAAGRSEHAYGPGDTCFPVPPGRDWTTTLHHVDCDVLTLPAALLEETAGTGPGPGAPVRLLSDRPYSAPAAARIWHTAQAARTIISAQPEDQPPALVTSSAARLLAATVLTAFPSTAFPGPTIEDRHDAHPAALRRAVSFIDDNAHRDITLADIAAAAFITPRAVQLAFRRHLDTTPLNYLRRVRLARAHHDLLTADPTRTTIAAIAYRWGFLSPSRFSAYYRRAYGTTPSQTLHRG